MPRNEQQQHLSPPAHLPTPLPEVPLHAPEPLAASSGLDHLIDMQHHYASPPFREAQLPDEEYEYERAETPPPLPIPPRIHAEYHSGGEERTGHTRTPMLPRSPTRLESLSRTIRTYTPSASAVLRSIHYVPSAIPSPPMVSRPLSYGRFSVDPDLSRPHEPYQQDEDSSFDYHPYHHEVSSPELTAPSGVTRALATTTDSPHSSYPHFRATAATRAPSSEKDKDTHADTITWALWDVLSHRRVLIIAYTTGIQIWDSSDLGSVAEILNLTLDSEDWAMDVAGRTVRFNAFVKAAVLPFSPSDLLASHCPLLGILLSSSTQQSAFFIYSLKNHQIVQRIALPGIASTFESNDHFIVITTTSPSTVHILSASTFHTLWTLDSASLATSTTQPVLYLSTQPFTPIDQPSKPPPAPVIALSGRLLAYASPSPRQSRRISSTSSSTGSGPSATSISSSPFRPGSGGDLGNAAIKVVSRGIAYEAAKNKIAEASGGPANAPSPIARTRFFSKSAPTDERAFSSSSFISKEDSDKDKIVTPHTNPVLESGYYVTVVDLQPLLQDAKPVKVAEFITSRSQPITRLAFSPDGCKLISVPENGQVTRVFSLRPRRSAAEGEDEERKVGDGVRMYNLRRGRTSGVVESLDCGRDGRWVAIGTKNRTVHVFPVNPFWGRPDMAGHLSGKVKNVDELQTHLVEVAPLVRLRPLSNSKSDQQTIAPLAFTFINPGDVHIPTSLQTSTSKYTTPVTEPTTSPPTSPNRPHRRAGNVQDILVFDPADGVLSLRRITIDQRVKDQLGGLAAAAVGVGGVVSRSLPGTVGSPMTRISASPGSVSRTSSTSTSTAAGDVRGASGAHAQEVVMELVGRGDVMATWNLQRKRDWKEIRKAISERGEKKGIGRFKQSFGADWLAQAELSTCSRSPRILPRSLYLSHQFTFWTFGEDYHALLRQYQFDVRGSKIHVRREVQVSIGVGLNNTSDRFVDDTTPIDFHDHQHQHQHHHGVGLGGAGNTSTSFDEPLASALAGDLVTDYHSTYATSVPAILPAYPNGVSGSSSKTPAFIRNSIPIRRLGDGMMSSGLGRIRKEISSSYYYQRSGRKPGPRMEGEEGGGTISVPLEFDEEDEDFLGVPERDATGPNNHSQTGGDNDIVNIDIIGVGGTSIGASTGISAESGLTTGTSVDTTSGTSASALDVGLPTTPDKEPSAERINEDMWKGWESREVGQMVEEMERFDDISVVGFLDEEHQREKEEAAARERERERERAAAAAASATIPSGRAKKGKKGKKRIQ
ncbi:hypothetical protein D9756_011356 [Leucocoprinus leucothites]|uniref:BCAS3 WD40 domain-containing protein n=1 Tax=Leucocoprinus leucothites TaxID=201217 RepID=A0A8H5CP69_9AGAR|nr:hypothetical protein D9756_011356 [Leucoagaricus leucothites]